MGIVEVRAMNHGHAHERPRSGLSSRVVIWGSVAILAFYLITEHRAHLYGALPFLLLFLCPLLHLFHGGHGGHGEGRGQHGGHGGSSPRRSENG
jgi:hypothetical protein